jgi:hypothetical protein
MGAVPTGDAFGLVGQDKPVRHRARWRHRPKTFSIWHGRTTKGRANGAERRGAARHQGGKPQQSLATNGC